MKYKLSFFVSSATFRALTRSSYIQIMTESHKIKRSYDVQLSFLLWLQQYVTEMGCTLDVGLVVLHFTSIEGRAMDSSCFVRTSSLGLFIPQQTGQPGVQGTYCCL